MGDSFTNALAVDCQVSTFFATAARPEGLPDEESRTRHVPSERALFGLYVGVGYFLNNASKADRASVGLLVPSSIFGRVDLRFRTDLGSNKSH